MHVVLNITECIFKQVEICETLEPCNVVECPGHFDGIVPSLACILTEQHGVHGGKYLLQNTPGNAISNTLNFKMSLDSPEELVPLVRVVHYQPAT